MFNKKYLDILSIERGAQEILGAQYHFNNFRREVKEARSFKGYDSEYLKPVKRQHVESAKFQYKLFKDCVKNAQHYLGASNKEATNALIFKYKYQQGLISVAQMVQLINM